MATSNKIQSLLRDLDTDAKDGGSDSRDEYDPRYPAMARRPRGTSPPPYRFPAAKSRSRSPVWRMDYDHKSLVHSPSHLAFQSYTHADGHPIQVLPPYNRDQCYTGFERHERDLFPQASALKSPPRLNRLDRDSAFSRPEQRNSFNQQAKGKQQKSQVDSSARERKKAKAREKRLGKRQREEEQFQREKSDSLPPVSVENEPGRSNSLAFESSFNSKNTASVNAIEISDARNRLKDRLPKPEPATRTVRRIEAEVSTERVRLPGLRYPSEKPEEAPPPSPKRMIRYSSPPSRPAITQQHMPATNGAGPAPPTGPAALNAPPAARTRRLPNHVQIADAYIFQQNIDERLRRIGVTHAREDALRLAGVQWIDQVRKALKLPVRTFATACVYYHKFRLMHADNEYAYVDAAAAALFAACKIEDTLKKSRDILCAAHNLKAPSRAEQLSPDDPMFEAGARTIIGTERFMLEASGFDFRGRYPQVLVVKLLKEFGYDKEDTDVGVMSYKISLDLYRTMAPLKMTTAVMAFACVELAERLAKKWDEKKLEEREGMYRRWGMRREMVVETLLDLLDIYTSYRTSTSLGPSIPLDTFLQVRIPLNNESSRRKLPRYTEYIELEPAKQDSNNNDRSSTNNGNRTTSGGGSGPGGRNAQAQHGTQNGTPNGADRGAAASARSSKNTSPQDTSSPGTNTTGGSASTAATAVNVTSAAAGGGATAQVGGVRQRASERGREGTVRFMLNPEREREERKVIAGYGEVLGR